MTTPARPTDEELDRLIAEAWDTADPPPDDFFPTLRCRLALARPVGRHRRWQSSSARSAVLGVAAVVVTCAAFFIIQTQQGGDGGNSPPRAGSGACGLVLRYRDRAYFGEAISGPVAISANKPERGQIPACEDQTGSGEGRSRSVRVYKITGVDPRIEVAITDHSPHAVYVQSGFYPQDPAFPFSVPNQSSHCVQHENYRFRARVVSLGYLYPFVVVERLFVNANGLGRGSRIPLFIDRDTRFHQAERYGVGHLTVGDSILVTARGCRASGAAQPRVLPSAIRLISN